MYKNTLLILILTLLFTACVNSSTQKQVEEETQKANFPIVQFVEDFVTSHPNFENNNITREQADIDFLKAFKETSDSVNLLKNIPVKLKAINKNSKGQVLAQFCSWIKPQGFEFPNPIDDVNFDIICEIDPQYIESLDDNSYYILDGKFIDRIESIYVFQNLLGLNTSIYTPRFSVRTDNIWENKYEVSLGMMYYDINSLEPFEQ